MYTTHDIGVRGGNLRVGEWGSGDPDASVIVAIHGMTGSHLAWSFLAAEMPEMRIIAPDLRGRGRSSHLPGPFGTNQHVADVMAVMEALNISEAALVGHSMGAFVCVTGIHFHPEKFTQAVLVDGGLPLTVPLGLSDEDLLEAVLGPAARGSDLTFACRKTSRKFWMLHPAFAEDWNETLSAYTNYDVEGEEPELRPSSAPAAVLEDSRELYGSLEIRTALGDVKRPMSLLAAPRGLLNDAPGVCSERDISQWQKEFPAIQITEVSGVNNYTLVLSARGAAAIGSELRRGLAASE